MYMKAALINESGKIRNSKYNKTYLIKSKTQKTSKTEFYSDRPGDFYRGETMINYLIDEDNVHSILLIKTDNFDGKGKETYYLSLVGQKYNSYLYYKSCVLLNKTELEGMER